MIVEKTLCPDYLSNTYLVGDEAGGHAVVIDTGGPTEAIVAAVERHRLTVTHVLCTHHHIDHVAHNDLYRGRFACPICAHADEADAFGGAETILADGDEIESGALRIRAIHTPGHTTGMLAFLVDEERLFTGDTLFRRTVGGTVGPGHATLDDLRNSIVEILLALPPDTVIHPGHTDPTTVAEEIEENPFVRRWMGRKEVAEERCEAFGQPATLLLRAPDYDGGTKCWVRFDEGDLEAVVPGSQVVSV
jgi:glyoxylase-like metal-dependent hydrolase (beta-lactamase superfamily II)